MKTQTVALVGIALVMSSSFVIVHYGSKNKPLPAFSVPPAIQPSGNEILDENGFPPPIDLRRDAPARMWNCGPVHTGAGYLGCQKRIFA